MASDANADARRRRILVVLLAATAAAFALRAAVGAHLGERALTDDPGAVLCLGTLHYCPGEGRQTTTTAACCDQPRDQRALHDFAARSGGAAERDIATWLALDVAAALLAATLVGLACWWAPPVLRLPAGAGIAAAVLAAVAGLAALAGDLALWALLRAAGTSAEPAWVERAALVAWACAPARHILLAPLAGLAIGLAWRRPDLFWRQLAYFAVLRPAFAFAAVLLYLPLAAIATAPLSSVLGNLLVDYDFRRAFWLGLTLFPAVWSLMFTTCLLLDSERKRDRDWVFDPGAARRAVTLPIRDGWVFAAFTALALPTVVVVAWMGDGRAAALAGTLAGGLAAYLGLDLSLALLRCHPGWRALPWTPLAARRLPAAAVAALDRFAAWFRARATRVARAVGMPRVLFHDEPPHELEDDHVFALWSLVVMTALYAALSLGLWLAVRDDCFGVLYRLPPAGFLYVLLLVLIWAIMPLWFLFRRYRLALAVAVAAGLGLAALSGTRGARYTFDAELAAQPPLTPAAVLAALDAADPARQRPLIVVAASGGGIAAAGWTAKVLAELRPRIATFDLQLRLLSTVSGGSVGAAHYLAALDGGGARLPPERLAHLVAASMDTSLSTTAYAFAFPEIQRLLLPLASGPSSDRGRLQERTWQWRARCDAPPRTLPLAALREPVLAGTRPAVIFNATLLETGERLAITNLAGLAPPAAAGPRRLAGPRTLSALLNDGPESPAWTTDLWTGARLSATFSYVSPAATVAAADLPAAARRHLIDGGYHDNFGVSSALDWLAAARDAIGPRPVALVEIRASPQAERTAPADALVSEWLGPPLGMWNAWWRSQAETNDTAVRQLEKTWSPGVFRSFLFVPDREPPLSWHLSRREKERICRAWSAAHGGNRQQLDELLAFLGEPPAVAEDLVDCDLPEPCK